MVTVIVTVKVKITVTVIVTETKTESEITTVTVTVTNYIHGCTSKSQIVKINQLYIWIFTNIHTHTPQWA